MKKTMKNILIIGSADVEKTNFKNSEVTFIPSKKYFDGPFTRFATKIQNDGNEVLYKGYKKIGRILGSTWTEKNFSNLTPKLIRELDKAGNKYDEVITTENYDVKDILKENGKHTILKEYKYENKESNPEPKPKKTMNFLGEATKENEILSQNILATFSAMMKNEKISADGLCLDSKHYIEMFNEYWSKMRF